MNPIDRMDPEARIAAIVLAGGRASRLGQPKPSAIVGGEPLLTRALRGVERYPTAVVGPAELDELVEPRDDLFITRESPAFGGPVAGIAAGYASLTAAGPAPEWLILLACDLPRAAEAVSLLVEMVPALADAEAGACLVADDRPQWLCGIYRAAAIRSGLERLRRGDGLDSASVRSLLGAFPLALIDGADHLAFDVDTSEDLRTANADERIDG
ncbi:MAG TPA: NTP transferase domain-containing protein [Leifsonia sp.]|jgi:molybdopterin-guanine dinucleotide biosynthesis protein A|nr:NTP transferase domain-containing protein [Leifsonia sp.]